MREQNNGCDKKEIISIDRSIKRGQQLVEG